MKGRNGRHKCVIGVKDTTWVGAEEQEEEEEEEEEEEGPGGNRWPRGKLITKR